MQLMYFLQDAFLQVEESCVDSFRTIVDVAGMLVPWLKVVFTQLDTARQRHPLPDFFVQPLNMINHVVTAHPVDW